MYPSLLVDDADEEDQTYKKYVIGVKEMVELDKRIRFEHTKL